MSVSPRAILGLPMYRSEAIIGKALTSLLEQDYDDFALVAIDDHSPDRTFEIAADIAGTDPRLVVERNAERAGMRGNFNRVFARACELYPGHELFAWVSDNDLRRPNWLSSLVLALDEHPDAVLAYGRTGGRDGNARTAESPVGRFLLALDRIPAGMLIFGLQRRAILERIGGIPPALVPDTLFLAQLSLYGPFVQTRKTRWRRGERRTGGSRKRQREALFAGDAPRSSYAPVVVQHTAWLLRTLVLGNRRPPAIGRSTALTVVLLYPFARASRILRRWWSHLRKRTSRLSRQREFARKRRRSVRDHSRKRIARRARREKPREAGREP